MSQGLDLLGDRLFRLPLGRHGLSPLLDHRGEHTGELILNTRCELRLDLVDLPEFREGPPTVGPSIVDAGYPIGLHGALLLFGILAAVALDFDDKVEQVLFSVAVVNKHHENQVNLYVADVSDGGKTFKKARLPFQLTEHSYTILDTSEGSVFLHVNHGDYHTGYGNIYLSDAEGLRFWIFRDGLYEGEVFDADGKSAPPRWYVHGLFA